VNLPASVQRWPDDLRYELHERAAIKEFDAGKPQAVAIAEAEREIRAREGEL
jgi:hypothetical protein